MQAFPIINYSEHPAFRNLPKNPHDLSHLLLPVFRGLDAMVTEFDDSVTVYTEAEIRDFYATNIAAFVDLNLTSVIKNEYRFNDDSLQVMLRSIPGLIRKLIDQSLYKNVKKVFNPGRMSTKAEKVFDDLTNAGVTTSWISDEAIREINEDMKPYKDEVSKMEDKNPFGRNAIEIPRRSRHWKHIADSMKSSGILKGASAFYGSHLRVTGCGLEHSSDKQTWWRNCYEDVGIPTSPCSYMHNDYDYDYVKSLVYLSPVTKKQGPFSYIPESHKWQREHSLSFYIKEAEVELIKLLKSKNIGKPNYYRRIMGIPEGRLIFYSMPNLFQQLSHFGDDVLAESDLCKELLSKEWQITSEDGNFAFFTGGTGIHRGSNVEEGERWAFQITLTREPDLRKKITSFSRNLTGTILSKALGERRMVQIQKKFNTVI